MSSTNPVALDAHALRTLKYVRESMEAASALAVPGSAGFLMGIVGLMACAGAQSLADPSQRLFVWLIAATIASLLGGATLWQQLRRRGRSVYTGTTKRFLLCLCPALISGAALTLIFMRNDLEQYVSGMWLLLYGSAVLSASSMTGRSALLPIASMGSIFVLLGAATLELPVQLHNGVLGFAFGGLHIVCGSLLKRVDHDC